MTSRSYNGPSAGHARFPTSVATSLARTGQLQTHITQNSLFTPGQFMPIFSQPWNSRTPVWERQIPDHSLRPAPKQRRRAGLPSLASERPSTVGSISTVSSDWPLLLSQEQPFRVRRPWPGALALLLHVAPRTPVHFAAFVAEYEPEAAAAVGRRWQGTCLGQLHEHRRGVRGAFPHL